MQCKPAWALKKEIKMAKRNIVQDGDPVLKKICRPVVKFNERLNQLLDDMGETMLDANGLGLAGPQVGVLRRLFVAVDDAELRKQDEDESYTPQILEFINPEILEKEGEELRYEGCLSFPGQWGAVARPTRVKVKALNRNGEPFTFEAEGLLARCLCHETNHLDGVTIDDLADRFYDPETPRDDDDALFGSRAQAEADEE